MPFTIALTPGRLVLTLQGRVTIRHAQELAAALGEVVEEGMIVGVETRGLEDVDTCVLQLLSSVRKSVAALSFDNASDLFIGEVDRRGLRRELLGREAL